MIGKTLAHYEITGLLGKGGMGEVYRARDTRLDREVALKLLPEDFAADADRVARFRREARLLAVLNHPNVAGIHGIEEDQGRIFLVMELAPGETLAARIEAGPVPADDAVGIGIQIARGLEAAHAKGIVHRDLKPANVKVTPEGEIKVLDFGLARAYLGEEAGADSSEDSPTMTAAMTQAGVILGTASYMSPEQARGHGVDARADVWAFGVILYELLTGRRLFAGETTSDTLAMVLRADPDWDALPADLSPSLVRLLKRCLQRDRRQRLHHIADARIMLEEIRSEGTGVHEPVSGVAVSTPGVARGGRLGWIVAAVFALAAVGLGWWAMSRPDPAVTRIAQLDLMAPAQTWISFRRQSVAISPLGDVIVIVAESARGRHLYRRALDDDAFEAIEGSDWGENPFFSPDARWIAFTQDGYLRKVPLAGGSPVDICQSEWGGGTWLEDGRIVFTRSYADGLAVVSAEGGKPESLTEPDMDRSELGHWWPQALPGDDWIVYTSWSTPIERARVMAYSLTTDEHRVLVEGGAFGRWAPTGHLVWVRDRQLLAAAFDRQTMTVTGPAVPVLDDVYLSENDGYANLAFSSDGTLLHAASSVMRAPLDLVWVDRQGRRTSLGLERKRYDSATLSPDGRVLAVAHDGSGNQDIWLHELDRGVWSRFTFTPSSDFNPIWSPDGKTIYYNGEEPQFTVYRRPADGSAPPELVLREPIDTTPTSVTPDGRYLICTYASPETDSDIWIVPVDDPGAARPFIQTPFSELAGDISPDGRWLAYASSESGAMEIYAMAFPDGGARVKVSADGGSGPLWSRDGREILYYSRDGLTSVPVVRDPDDPLALTLGRPEVLFLGSYVPFWIRAQFDVTADGQQFVMVHAPPESMPRRLRVIVNWFDRLEAQMAVR